MQIPAFDCSLKKSAEVLKELEIDLYEILKSLDAKKYTDNTLNCMIGITAIQVRKCLLFFLLDLTQIWVFHWVLISII